jgi:hypothetical protein
MIVSGAYVREQLAKSRLVWARTRDGWETNFPVLYGGNSNYDLARSIAHYVLITQQYTEDEIYDLMMKASIAVREALSDARLLDTPHGNVEFSYVMGYILGAVVEGFEDDSREEAGNWHGL